MVSRSNFIVMQGNFVRRLFRFMELPHTAKAGNFNIDDLVNQISIRVRGDESITQLILSRIDRDDRRILDNMRQEGHPLTDIRSSSLFGPLPASDRQRLARYEVIGALMADSSFPHRLLDSSRWSKWRFDSVSAFFRQRGMEHLNEQCISCWARRLLCFFAEIANVRVPGRELRDRFVMANEGMTTERLLTQELRGFG